MKNWLKFLCFLFLLTGCAKTPISLESGENLPQKIWQDMQERQVRLSPCFSEGSLRFGTQDEKHRVQYLLWANIYPPVRFDILATSTLAKIYEDKDKVIVLIPEEKQALQHKDAQKALEKFGIATPFTLYELTKIMQGLFPISDADIKYEHARREGDIFVYTLPTNIVWELDFNSRPIAVKNESLGDKSYEVRFSYKEGIRPSKIEAQYADGSEFTLFIRENVEKDIYPSDSFLLEIPRDYEYIDLEKIENKEL